MKNRRDITRLKRHKRIRVKIQGSQERPRLIIKRSLHNLSAQIIDDTNSRTLFSISTRDREIREKFPYSGNIKSARYFGEVLAKKAMEKGIKKLVFDRAGYLYHGRIKECVENIRKGGLEF